MLDVIIVGAGPAGSIAAFELARKGFSTLIIEKAPFPRYKVCGGGLTHKIIREIPFDVSEVIETTIFNVRFSKDFQTVFTRNSATPIIYCTMRDRLDHFLLNKAVEAGAKILYQQVTYVDQTTDRVLVETKTERFEAKLLIGADGPSSIVARRTGLRKNIEQGLAWEAEIFTDPSHLEKYQETVFLDWGTFPGGYGWAFPKKDHFSIGVGGPAKLAKQMMPYFNRFLNYLNLDSQEAGLADLSLSRLGNQRSLITSKLPYTASLRSWPIPVRTKKGDFHSGRILVAGDAGGLTDALTGEGIYYAVVSGKMASVACYSYLQGEEDALINYSKKVNEILLTELLEGYKIKHIFNVAPMKIHTFVRDSDRAWRAFGKVLRGEREYSDVKKGFGIWRIFWNSAAYLASFMEKKKERDLAKNEDGFLSN